MRSRGRLDPPRSNDRAKSASVDAAPRARLICPPSRRTVPAATSGRVPGDFRRLQAHRGASSALLSAIDEEQTMSEHRPDAPGGDDPRRGDSTNAVHGGERVTRESDAITTPIYQTSTYTFRDSEQVRAYQEGRSRATSTVATAIRPGAPSSASSPTSKAAPTRCSSHPACAPPPRPSSRCCRRARIWS